MNLRFTHIGLFVRDPERLGAFYKSVLGFTETDRGVLNGRDVVFLSRDPDEHHQLIFFSGLTAPPREDVVNQISFRVSSLEALLAFIRQVQAIGADDIQSVTHGNAWSVYFRDPEGNRIEVYTPSPWYVDQPCRVPLDVNRPADEIRAETEAWCRSQEGFVPAETRRAQMAALMGVA